LEESKPDLNNKAVARAACCAAMVSNTQSKIREGEREVDCLGGAPSLLGATRYLEGRLGGKRKRASKSCARKSPSS
jgi:hypothetical protein